MPNPPGTKSISGFDPRTVAKCCLWLDSSDSNTLFSDAAGTTPSTLNGAVGFWKDKSGANTNVSNATSAQQPSYTTDGVSYASATNSGKALVGTPPILSSGGLAAFVVFNPTSLTTGTGRKSMVRLWTPAGYLVSLENWYAELTIPNGYAYQYTRPIIGVNNLMSVVTYSKGVNNNGNTITQIGYDLNFETSSTSWLYKNDGTNYGNELGIGSRPSLGFTFDGTISEVIVYDSFLTSSQKQDIQRYLAQKWNVTTQRFNPTSISGCVLWNDASTLTGSGAVGTWSNLAGSAYSIACTGIKTPNGRNGLTTVRLTTTQTWIPDPNVALGSHTLFWSGRQTGGTNKRVLQGTSNNHLYGYFNGHKRAVYNNAAPEILYTSPSDTEWDIFSYSRVAEGAYRFSWNGTVLFSGASSTGSWMDGLRINSGVHSVNPPSDERSDCEIGEIILYNRVLTEDGNYDECRMVERYLDAKWNKSLRLANNFPLDTVSPRLRAFQPTDFRDCYCWIDAAQDTTALGTNVTTIPNWSGTTVPNITPFGGNVSLQAYDQQKGVYLFSSSRALSDPGFVWNSSFTQFAVVQCAPLGQWMTTNLVPANNGYYNYVLSGNIALYYDTVMQVNDSGMPPNVSNRSVFEYASGGKTSWVIFSIGHRSGDSNLTNYTVNGRVLSSTSQTASSITNVGKLVLNGNATAAGDTTTFLCEFIHYNRSLSQPERQQVEGYLAQKWNITLVSPSFTPTTITGCTTWLDASDTSTTTNIATGIWVDKSTRAVNTTSNAGGGAFSLGRIGGLPAVSFPATAGSAGLNVGSYSLPTSTGITLFMVLYPTSVASGGTRILSASSLQIYNYGTPTKVGIYTGTALESSILYATSPSFVLSATIQTSLVQIFSNGILAGSNTSASTTYTSFMIGNFISGPDAAYAYIGLMGEVIIYNNVLTIAQRTQVETYLMDKWKIASHPFKTIPPNVTDSFTPASLSRCQLWLDGLDPAGTRVIPADGSTVTTWIDKSGNANHGTGNGTPTYVSNGGINFDGSSYFSNTAFKMTFANRSMFFVMKETTRTNASVLSFIPTPSNQHDYFVQSGITFNTDGGFQTFGYWYGGPLGYQYRMGDPTLLPRGIYNDNMNTVVGSGYVNGSNAANKTAIYSATTCSGYVVAGRWYQDQGVPAGGKLNGVIYEIIAYDRGLTNSERQQVEGYLAWKWNLNSSLPTSHPFFKVSPGPELRSIMLNRDELYLWLDASDLSTLYQGTTIATPVTATAQNVGLWLDKSGNQRNYAALLATYPTYSTKSQVPEVECNLANKVFYSTLLPAGCRPLDIFVVTQVKTSSADWRTLFRGSNNDHHVMVETGSYRLGAYYTTPGFRQYGSLTLDGTRRVVLHVSISSGGLQAASVTPLGEAYDGNLVMSAAADSNANDNLYYFGGWRDGTQTWGNISETLIFKRNLANQEKIEVFNYLNSKWLTRVRLSNAVDYLPLSSNATNLGTTPQTVTTLGTVTYTAVGGKSGAFFNNNIANYIKLNFTNPEQLSLCFWLYPLLDGTTTLTSALSLTTDALVSGNMALVVDVTNTTTLTVYSAIPNQWTSINGGTASNAWTHYTITINSKTYVMELYVNGANRVSVTGSGVLKATDRIVLGRIGSSTRPYWGYIRQFAVFNTILTPYEVQDIFNASA